MREDVVNRAIQTILQTWTSGHMRDLAGVLREAADKYDTPKYVIQVPPKSTQDSWLTVATPEKLKEDWTKMPFVEKHKWVATNILHWSVVDMQTANRSHSIGTSQEVSEQGYTFVDSDGRPCIKRNKDVVKHSTLEETWATCPHFTRDMNACLRAMAALRKEWHIQYFNGLEPVSIGDYIFSQDCTDNHEMCIKVGFFNSFDVTIKHERVSVEDNSMPVELIKISRASAANLPEAICLAMFLFTDGHGLPIVVKDTNEVDDDFEDAATAFQSWLASIDEDERYATLNNLDMID